MAAMAILLIAANSFAQDNKWKFSWENRPAVTYGDLIRIDFRARLIGDVRRSDPPLQQTDTSRFDIARRRIGAAGVIADVVDFQIERELADEGGWRDVYANYRTRDGLNLQAGHFKLPFGLDENTSSTNLDFVYRSRAATLSPGRDPGVMAHGRVRVFRYAAGVFTRDGDNGRGRTAPRASTSLTTAGRFLVQPFRSSKSVFEDFQAGVAFTTADVRAGVADFAGPIELRDPFFRPEFAVQGRRHRTGLEMRWRPGPFSVQSELVRMTGERRGQSIEDTDLPSVTASSWYAHGAWILTGENKTQGADEPKRPLFDGGFGSVELAARIESMHFSSTGAGPPSTGPRAETILPHRDRAVTLGVNWSPNRWMRVQANLIRDTMTIPTGEGPLSGPLVDGPASSFWSRVVRFRFAL